MLLVTLVMAPHGLNPRQQLLDQHPAAWQGGLFSSASWVWKGTAASGAGAAASNRKSARARSLAPLSVPLPGSASPATGYRLCPATGLCPLLNAPLRSVW